MRNVWDDLPNAKHINRVIVHFKAHSKKWSEVWNSIWILSNYRDTGAAIEKESLLVIERANRNSMMFALMEEVWGKSWTMVWTNDVVRNALLALIAYDDCAYMLDFTPEQIHLYACLGIPAAILLAPAVEAMYNA